MLKVGINGFGRIGKAVFRVNHKKKIFDVVAINDINEDNNNLAYMLSYDSIYGRFDGQVSADESGIIVENKKIKVYHSSNIDAVPWENEGIDVVIDASGISENVLRARNLAKRGIKCIVTHSPDEDKVDKTIIMGVNEYTLSRNDFIISSSICDAIAFSPTINTLNEHFGVDHGYLTTLHPWLSYQNLLDGPSKSYASPGKTYHHYVLGRGSTISLIPKPTSCITASCKVLDFLKGRFLSLSFRVPTGIVSSADVSVKLNKRTTAEEIIELFKKKEAEQKLKIFYNNFEPLVSVDFTKSEYSAVIDHRWTKVNDSNYIKMILWYDNEWGYSNRVVDLVKHLETLD